MRRAPCFLFALLWLVVEPSAEVSAQGPIAEAITLTPNATCLERNAIEGQVEAWLGSAQIPADIHVSVRGSNDDPRSASFHIERAKKIRERRFDHLPVACADATAVVGLAIALAIDASLLDDWVLPAAANTSPSADTPTPAPAEAQPKRIALTAQVAAAHAVIPGTAGGLKVGLGYAPTVWLNVHLQGLALFSFDNHLAGTHGVFDADALAALPVLCAGGSASPRVRLDLCSGAALGVLQVRGRNFLRSGRQQALWSELFAGLRVVLQGHIQWVLDVQAALPLRVPPIAARNGENLPLERRPDPVGVMASFGPEFVF